jgi:hypothetical protein
MENFNNEDFENEDLELVKEGDIMTESKGLAELRVFLEDYVFEKLEDKKIKKDYPQVLSALLSGKLVLGEEVVYTLRQPICFKTGVVDIDTIKFKTRITVTEKENLAKNQDIKDNPLAYSYACMANVMNLQSKAYLNKVGKYDFKVCEQLATLFV